VASVGRCGRRFLVDVCATAGGRCAAACVARATCDELDRNDDGERPGWLAICLYPCRETFTCDDGSGVLASWVCDAENDCVDGSDERACEYFECASGMLVSTDSQCDEWPDCDDWSDEDACSHFLCEDRSVIPRLERCDGRADCADGRDEEDCP
jgi:hypothetical protein